MRELYATDAIREGLIEAMAEDQDVLLLGEDVERSIIGTTKGLIDQFGSKRVRNTPISENAVLSACVGAAAAGIRPVFDIMFSSFFYVCLDAIANQASRMRYMSGGQASVPLTVIAPTGPAGSAGAQHSENPHPMLMGLSGVKIAFPSTPADFKGLLIESIRDPNPVVFFADLVLLGQKGAVPEGANGVQFGRAAVRREGTDVTVVAIGSTVSTALSAAEELEVDGISVEVIDPRSLVPFDWNTVAASVTKTGRLVAVDPARRTCGAAADIVAQAVERCWSDLKAQPQRVTWPDVPMPFSPPLEKSIVANVADIVDAVRATL